VVVDPAGEPAPDVPSVGAPNWNGGLAATRHLIELGHRRIGMIGGPATMLCSRARVDGYRAALETAGLPVDPELIRWGTFHVEAGYENGRALLSLPEPPTAIFAPSDTQAMGVLKAARERGLWVPRELAVVGFDDVEVAEYIGLTTVRQPLEESGRVAVDLLLARLVDGTRPVQHVRLPLKIIQRETA
jgi:DNA-binding LacI/PurR family transcriptional regulator